MFRNAMTPPDKEALCWETIKWNINKTAIY